MNSALRKQILKQANDYYPCYKIGVLTEGIIGLPKDLYAQPQIILDAGNELGLPTCLAFLSKVFHMTASFDKVVQDLEIPYANLVVIYDYKITEGIMFFRKISSVPPVKNPPALRLVN